MRPVTEGSSLSKHDIGSVVVAGATLARDGTAHGNSEMAAWPGIVTLTQLVFDGDPEVASADAQSFLQALSFSV